MLLYGDAYYAHAALERETGCVRPDPRREPESLAGRFLTIWLGTVIVVSIALVLVTRAVA